MYRKTRPWLPCPRAGFILCLKYLRKNGIIMLLLLIRRIVRLRFLDLNEDITLQIAIWAGHIMVTGSYAESAGVRGWHRIRGLRGWFAPRVFRVKS